MTSQNLAKGKRKIHKLKDPKLRKIRYELRSLLFSIYKKEYFHLLGMEKKDFKMHFFLCPIVCWLCGTRMEDLIQDPDTKFWFCVNHYSEQLDEETTDHRY